jgi:hypothetical protein
MPGKKSQLTPLEARKQLLLVESELNRVQMLNEVRDWKNELHNLKQQMQTIGSMASAAAKLAATFSTVSRAFSHRDEGDNQPSWVSTLLNGAQAGTSLWLLLRSCWRKS